MVIIRRDGRGARVSAKNCCQWACKDGPFNPDFGEGTAHNYLLFNRESPIADPKFDEGVNCTN
jgi:hypothetical protein